VASEVLNFRSNIIRLESMVRLISLVDIEILQLARKSTFLDQDFNYSVEFTLGSLSEKIHELIVINQRKRGFTALRVRNPIGPSAEGLGCSLFEESIMYDRSRLSS